jgi:large subunit ribosomal protein L22
VNVDDLYISRVIADCGPTLKRFRAASMGRASQIRKRTCHITIELDEHKRPMEEAKADKAKAKAEVKEKGGPAKAHAPRAAKAMSAKK